MQGQAIGLKRRIGVVVAATVMATALVATPAQAASLGRFCERNFDTKDTQERCCHNRADNNRQEHRCLDYVRSHH
jgi:hypothetical protein